MSDDDLNIPQRLADDLSDVADARILVPREVDDAILAEARRRLSLVPAPAAASRGWRIGVPVAGAIAAALLLGVSVWMFQANYSLEPAMTPRSDSVDAASEMLADTDFAADEDVDGSGSVNIVDAFMLARTIDAGSPPSPAYDYNDDGVVDQADVDHLARRAVALHTPGGAG